MIYPCTYKNPIRYLFSISFGHHWNETLKLAEKRLEILKGMAAVKSSDIALKLGFCDDANIFMNQSFMFQPHNSYISYLIITKGVVYDLYNVVDAANLVPFKLDAWFYVIDILIKHRKINEAVLYARNRLLILDCFLMSYEDKVAIRSKLTQRIDCLTKMNGNVISAM